MGFAKSLSPYLLSVLRIMTGLLLLQHGAGKWLGFPAGVAGYPQSFSNLISGLPGGFVSSGMAGLFEIVGGVLIVLGLFTRPVALILSGMTAVAYFYVARSTRLLPDPQRRRAGCALFVRLPLPLRSRRRRLVT